MNTNSAAIQFQDIGWFRSPDEKSREKEIKILLEEQEKLRIENTKIEKLREDFPGVFEYIDSNIVEYEKELTYEKIEENLKEWKKI